MVKQTKKTTKPKVGKGQQSSSEAKTKVAKPKPVKRIITLTDLRKKSAEMKAKQAKELAAKWEELKRRARKGRVKAKTTKKD